MKIINKSFLSALIIYIFISLAHAQDEPKYIWDSELDQLPDQQKAFVVEIVKAYRENDVELGISRLHSSIISHDKCLAVFKRRFVKKNIREEYAVKVKPGKKPDSLSFSIRDQNKGDASKRNFFKMKNVVEENGKFVINIDCEAHF